MMKKLALKAWFVFTLLIFSTAVAACESWEGIYQYEEEKGTTYGGSPIAQRYTVTISYQASPTCEIAVYGFQTLEELVCELREERESSITLFFKSYKNGKSVNAYGVRVYEPREPLLKFERIHEEGKPALLTHWLGLQRVEGKEHETGVFFKIEHRGTGDDNGESH